MDSLFRHPVPDQILCPAGPAPWLWRDDALSAGLMEGHKDVWNVNVLAQYAGVAALGDGEYQDASRRLVAAEGIHLYEALQNMAGLEVFRPCVNFLLWRLVEEHLAEPLIAALRGEGILVRSCANLCRFIAVIY